ncbi:MAG: PAS domain S-box protein, partial [Gammaproteobacteria bacterium]
MNKDRQLLYAITDIQSSWVKQGDSKELYQLLLSKLLELTESEYGFIGEVLYKNQRPYLKTHAISNIAWDQATQAFYAQHAAGGLEFYKLESLYGTVLTSGQPVIANNPYNDPRRGGLPEGHPRMHAFMGLPFTHNGEMLGMVGVANRNGGYDQADVEYIKPFLETCSNILVSRRLRQEHLSAETRLKNRENLLLEILERIPSGILVVDSKGSLCYMNRTAMNIVGDKFTEDFSLSRLPQLCQVYLEGTDQYYAYERMPIIRALHGETATCVDMEIRQGETRLPLQVTATPIKDNSGKITHAVATFNEITELKRQQARIREEEGLHRAILDSAVDAIITIDDHGIIQRVNPATARMFGYSRAELLGENIKVLITEPDRSRHDEYMQNYLRTGQSKIIGIGREVEVRCKDGSLLPCDLTITEVKLPEKRLFKGILRDITERKRIDNMKKEFISTVSHELRTPLTAIRGSLELLLGGAGGALEPLAKELLEIAGSSVDRLILLVNDILDMEKLESGGMKFDLQPQALMPLVEQAVVANQAYAKQYGTFLQITSGLSDLTAVVDTDRFIQVLTNLLSNAAKFSPAGQPVEIYLNRFDGKVRVTVADQGPGIPDAVKDQLFKKFSQLEHSDSQRKGGTGLGLCISKALIERMGGSIGLDSEVGSGSRFYMELPIYQPLIAEVKTETTEFAAGLAAGQRILVCEDDPDIAKLLKLMLEKGGFQADMVNDWSAAFRLLNSYKYGAMTLDLMLPDQHWSDIFKQLRRSDKLRRLPVIVVSAIAKQAKHELKGDALCVVDWLSKPIDEKRLIAAVTQSMTKIGEEISVPQVLYINIGQEQENNIAAILEDVAHVVMAPSLAAADKWLKEMDFHLVIVNLNSATQTELLNLPLLSHRDPPIPLVVISGWDIENEIFSEIKKILTQSPY